MMNQKTLKRNTQDRILGGVCSGMADYMDVEPWLIRLVCALLLIASFPFMLLLYIMFWIIMPPDYRTDQLITNVSGDMGTVPEDVGDKERSNLFLGLLLIAVGLLFLFRNFVHWFAWEKWWPVLIILLGLALMFGSGSKDDKTTEINTDETNSSGENKNIDL